MPIDSEKLSQQKERILSYMRIHGPSLPVQIGKAINSSTLFASAFLSELFAERKIKISNIRVGSSPLYFLPGQEPLLERFTNHLNQREKEAFFMIKNELVLEDESLPPVMRVAIRSLKDFAVPLRARVNEEVRTIWKYFLVEDSKIKQILNEKIFSKESSQKSQINEIPQTLPISPIESTLPVAEIPAIEIKSSSETPILQKEEKNEEKKEIPVIKQETKKKVKKQKEEKEHKFPIKVEEFLKSRDIEILSFIEKKKKEMSAKIRIDTLLGKQEFYLIAKDKNRINETDISLALQKAQSEKMSALIVSPGEVDKKALPYMKEWRNLVKFEKIK